MQSFTSPAASSDDEKRDLEYLLEVFSSMVSLKDIASAYCQARHNVELAAEILCTSHVGSSDSAGSSGVIATCSEGLESEWGGASAVPAVVSSDKIIQTPFNGVRNTIASKSKKLSVTVGTVSGVIGKEYTRPRASKTESVEMKKPLKLDLKEVPASEIWSEEVEPTMPEQSNIMHADVEEFLFKMLGEGFKLDMNVIREVLGLCGYDVQKSMEKLLFMSAPTLAKSDDVVGSASTKSTEKCSDQHSALSDGSRNMKKSPIEEEDGVALQKEVLEALFHVPERSDEAPKRSLPAREVKRYKYKPFERIVVEPFRDTLVECKTEIVAPQGVTRAEDGDDENSYEVLRKSVKEYWITMKEYYKAAFDALCEGDRLRSDQHLEKGHFFSRKAREADEKSAQMLLQVQSREDVVSLDLHHHEPKEAIRLLRLQLTHLSGIPAFKYLRLILGTNDEDTRGEAQRRLIMKQLEKESIKWTEENGGTILIRLDVIDPKSLTFKKNQ